MAETPLTGWNQELDKAGAWFIRSTLYLPQVVTALLSLPSASSDGRPKIRFSGHPIQEQTAELLSRERLKLEGSAAI